MNEILSRQSTDMSQVTKTAILTQGASTAEYGRIIIFKKGMDHYGFPVRNDSTQNCDLLMLLSAHL